MIKIMAAIAAMLLITACSETSHTSTNAGRDIITVTSSSSSAGESKVDALNPVDNSTKKVYEAGAEEPKGECSEKSAAAGIC
jgi:ABC-type glycerol-3-phosphate transport system substrate-binding protein